MTEATIESPRSSRAPAASKPSRSVNGVPLRWTPGPDERRLPYEEFIPRNSCQVAARIHGFSCLREHWHERQDVFVGSDQFLYWDPAHDPETNPENPPAVPDVYVTFDVADRDRYSYVAWEEGKPPDFVLEVTSPSSRKQDAEEKPGLYAKIGVPEFFIYDPGYEDDAALTSIDPKFDGFEPTLAGFELRGGRGGEYRPLPKERLPIGVVGIRSKVLGLWLCIKRPRWELMDDWLRWYDPATGKFLPTYSELADEFQPTYHELGGVFLPTYRELADVRDRLAAVQEAEARAAASEARVAELEALIEKMRRG